MSDSEQSNEREYPVSLYLPLFLCVFLPVIFLIYHVVHGESKNCVLAAAGLIYWIWSDPYHVLAGLVLVVFGFQLGKIIDRLENGKRRSAYVFGVIVALLYLFLCKQIPSFDYSQIEFAKTIHPDKLFAMPIGASFLVFSLISYLGDIAKGKVPAQKTMRRYLVFILFFPKLLMGPIVRYEDFEEQLDPNRREQSSEKIAAGIRKYIFGVAKKVLIADSLVHVVNMTFAHIPQLTIPAAWLGIIAYMIQIYFDFSSHGDMAIGIGMMFGFRMKKNFDYPYMSSSIAEFWRRWHISLGAWFREYVYIPLGGSRKGIIRTCLNTFMIFFLTGLWHGSGDHFVVWGLIQGCFVILERIWLGPVLKKDSMKILRHIYTLFVTLMSWVMFRCKSVAEAVLFYKVMFFGQGDGTWTARELLGYKFVLILLLGIIGCGPLQAYLTGKINDGRLGGLPLGLIRNAAAWMLFALSILGIVSGTFQGFIYAQF